MPAARGFFIQFGNRIFLELLGRFESIVIISIDQQRNIKWVIGHQKQLALIGLTQSQGGGWQVRNWKQMMLTSYITSCFMLLLNLMKRGQSARPLLSRTKEVAWRWLFACWSRSQLSGTWLIVGSIWGRIRVGPHFDNPPHCAASRFGSNISLMALTTNLNRGSQSFWITSFQPERAVYHIVSLHQLL